MSNRGVLIAAGLGALALAAAACAPAQSLNAQQIYAESYLRDVQAAQAATQEIDARRAIDASLSATEAAAQQALNDAEAQRLELAAQALDQSVADAEAKRAAEAQAVNNQIAIDQARAQALIDQAKAAAIAQQEIEANAERIARENTASALQTGAFTIAALFVCAMLVVICVLLSRYVWDLYHSERRASQIRETALSIQTRRQGFIPDNTWTILPDGSMIMRIGGEIKAAHQVLAQLPPAVPAPESAANVIGGLKDGRPYAIDRASRETMNDPTREAYEFLLECEQITGPATIKLPTAEAFVMQHKCRREHWQAGVRLLSPVYVNGRPGKGTFLVHARYQKLGALIKGFESGEIVIAEPSTAPRISEDQISVEA